MVLVPIVSGEMDVADTFKEDGTRPIAESPDFLLQNNDKDASSTSGSQDNSAIATDSQSGSDVTDDRVVDTFESDGTRPVMANEYEVVDTLGVDGNRPITNESYIPKKKQ